MSKYHKIKWQDADLKELNRVVRNYNAKVKRLKNKYPEEYKNALPQFYDSKTDSFSDKVSVRQLKEIINTRQDLKRELNMLRRFSKKGAETLVDAPENKYNLKITKWQRTEMKRKVAIINRKRKKRLEELQSLEMKSRGESLGYTRGEFGMGKLEEVSLSPTNAFTPSMSRTSLNWKWRSVMSESQSDYFNKRDYLLRDNYLKGIKENYDYENVKDIIEHIEKMDIKEFLNVFNQEDSAFEIASPDGQLDLKYEEYQSYETALRSTWLPNKSTRVTSKTKKKTKKK